MVELSLRTMGLLIVTGVPPPFAPIRERTACKCKSFFMTSLTSVSCVAGHNSSKEALLSLDRSYQVTGYKSQFGWLRLNNEAGQFWVAPSQAR